MTREDYQQLHGQQMAQILRLPAFTQGLVLLSLEITTGITNLGDEQIKENAMLILADYRGRLRNSMNLLTLPVPEETTPVENLTEVYPDRVDEAFEQFTKSHPKL